MAVSPGLQKRSRDEETCNHRRTRTKFTSSGPSSASEQYISDVTALLPSNVPAEPTAASDSDDGDDSELSSSSEDPSSESSSDEESDEDSAGDLEESRDENGVINLPANRGRKPKMRMPKEDLGPDIRDFLKDFLPQLKAANEDLERSRRAGTLKEMTIEAAGERGEAEGQYIEMDLGLGVLEEQDPDASDTSSDGDAGDQAKEASQGKDVLAKLMGQEIKREGAGIQEVVETDDT
jgi:hypothetical protein